MRGALISIAIHSLVPAVCLLALLSFVSAAEANPAGGAVNNGSATISSTGPVETITQTSQNAVINWQSFNIAPNETTRFNQPNSSSITLNRVNTANPSQILGTLNANGNVVLINPSGVFFGPGSKTDVNGLVATTANISNQNFMSGNLNFSTPGNPNGAIINQGTITAGQAGLVGLVAPTVVNSGTINAKLGHVDLAAGDTFTLDTYGDGLINVGVSDAVKQQLIQNSGAINAAGGSIALTAAAGRKVINSLIAVPGELKTPTAQMQDGAITISNASGAVQVNGALDATGLRVGQTGGSINVTGTQVSINSGATVNASGAVGGGAVNIGRNLHGHGPLANSQDTLVASGASVKANALKKGNGGKVVIWSDKQTTVNGSVQARGGAYGGNGGFIETSSHGVLNVTTAPDASAPHGQSGQWLLDPASVTITNSADSNMSSCPACVPNGSVATSNLSTATIDTALDAGTNVTVTTGGDSAANAGDITVSNAITTTGAGSLALSAFNDIIVNAGITLQGGNLTLQANNANTGSGYVNISGAISTNGGNITMGGGSGPITAGSGFATGSASVDGDAAQAAGVLINGVAVNAAGGNITVNGRGLNAGTNNNYGVEMTGGSITTSGAGAVNISGLGNGNTNSGNDYGVIVGGGAVVSTVNGNLTVNGIGGGAGSGPANFGLIVSGTGSAIETIGSGNISVTGIGGDPSGSGVNNYGVYVNVANGIQATGTGTISETGTGGASSSSGNYGIDVEFPITGNGIGAVSVTGTGGSGTGNGNVGVLVGANITNTGSGTIILSGNGGGAGNSGNDYGVQVGGGAVVSTLNGNVTVNGSGGGAGSGPANFGLFVTGAGSAIQTTGAGSISVTGNGGNASGSGVNNYGVYIDSTDGIQTKGAGAISVTGTGVSGDGVYTDASNAILSSGGAVNFSAPATGIYLNNSVTLGGNTTLSSAFGPLLFGGTVDGDYDLTGNGLLIIMSSPFGSLTPLNALSLTSTHVLNLPSITAASIAVQAAGADSNLILNAGTTLTASGNGTAITLAAGRNFLNASGSGALSAPNGRWLIYSTNPLNNTLNGIAAGFSLYNCTYEGACQSAPGVGNGLLYTVGTTSTQPPIIPGTVAATVSGPGDPNQVTSSRTEYNASPMLAPPFNPCLTSAAQDTLSTTMTDDLDLIGVSSDLAAILPFYKMPTHAYAAFHVVCSDSALSSGQ